MIKNPQDVAVFMGSNNAQASIAAPGVEHIFAFNPDEVKWSFSNNTVSRDTIGGRVVQLLSSKVDQMTVVGRAGSRGELQRLAKNLKQIMNYQIKNQTPVSFKVPSKDWNFKVYLQNVSSLGWDYAATSYPYEITFLVQDNLTGLTNKSVEDEALQRLAEGIGYSDKFHGGNADSALAISESYQRAGSYLSTLSRGTAGTGIGTGGNGFVPEYGIAPVISGSPGIQFYMNIPEENFRMRTGTTPEFVLNNPYLYKWTKNGYTVIFQYDAMIAFAKAVAYAGFWIWAGRGGTFRTYLEQVTIYNDKPEVAAKPGKSFHELGIAIDIGSATLQTNARLIVAMQTNNWRRFAPEPEGEPWHWSYGITG